MKALTVLPCSPFLALPGLGAGVPLTVASNSQARANAALCRFLIEAGAVREGDLPESESDPLKACERAIDAWVKRQVGPLQCLEPRFAVGVLDEHGHRPAMRGERQTAYAQLDVYWCEYREAEWAVGEGLEALNAAMPHLGATVLQVLRDQSRHVYPLFTPDIACDVASYVYWQGEMDEEAALDMMCGTATKPNATPCARKWSRAANWTLPTPNGRGAGCHRPARASGGPRAGRHGNRATCGMRPRRSPTRGCARSPTMRWRCRA
jgi:PRTRC genetic system protein F